MRARIVVAVLVGSLSAAGAACFSSNNQAPPPGDDASMGGDGPAQLDGVDGADGGGSEAASDATPGADVLVDSSSALDAPSEAASMLDATADAPGDGGASDGPVSEGAAADAGGGFVRVANMAATLSSIDFCVEAASASSFAGPYMHSQGGLAIPYRSVSELDALPAASGYTVRIVAGGATDCSAGLVPDVSVGSSLATAASTVVLEGTTSDAGAPLHAVALTGDDPTSFSSGTRMRALHAAPSVGAVSYEIGVSPFTQAIQAGVVYGASFTAGTASANAPTPDAQGYLTTDYGQAQVTLLLGGVETVSFFVGASGDQTASATAFLVGSVGSGSDPLGFVTCDDLGTPDGSTHLSPCTFSSAPPSTVTVRVLHAAPDQAAVEVCAGLGPSDQGFSANLLGAAGITGGLAFGQLSGVIVTMPAGTDIKLGYVLANQTCSTGGQFLTVGTGLNATEWTFALYESVLEPSVNYDIYLFTTAQTTDPSFSLVSFANMTALGAGPSIDAFTTEASATETEAASAIMPYQTSGFVSLTPDTYSLRIADDATSTTLYSTTGVPLAANEAYLMGWVQGTAAQGILARCPLSQRSANVLTSCPH